jgi:hypothetical protein
MLTALLMPFVCRLSTRDPAMPSGGYRISNNVELIQQCSWRPYYVNNAVFGRTFADSCLNPKLLINVGQNVSCPFFLSVWLKIAPQFIESSCLAYQTGYIAVVAVSFAVGHLIPKSQPFYSKNDTTSHQLHCLSVCLFLKYANVHPTFAIFAVLVILLLWTPALPYVGILHLKMIFVAQMFLHLYQTFIWYAIAIVSPVACTYSRVLK